MQFEKFMELAAERIGVESESELRAIVQAALATLGERIYRTGRDDLAAQLPKKIQKDLYNQVDGEAVRIDTDRFPLEEYYHRVAARADISYPQAVEWSREVMAVLRKAVSPAVLAELVNRLPDNYQQLISE